MRHFQSSIHPACQPISEKLFLYLSLLTNNPTSDPFDNSKPTAMRHSHGLGYSASLKTFWLQAISYIKLAALIKCMFVSQTIHQRSIINLNYVNTQFSSAKVIFSLANVCGNSFLPSRVFPVRKNRHDLSQNCFFSQA